MKEKPYDVGRMLRQAREAVSAAQAARERNRQVRLRFAMSKQGEPEPDADIEAEALLESWHRRETRDPVEISPEVEAELRRRLVKPT